MDGRVLVLVLAWMVGGVVAILRVGGEESSAVFFHLAAAGATTAMTVRGVARQRGLTI